MGVKAYLQKGRGKPGLILPANAVAKVNQASDRSALVRLAEHQETLKQQVLVHTVIPAELLEPMPNIGKSIAAKAASTLTVEAHVEVLPELPPVEPKPLPDVGLSMVDKPEPEDFEPSEPDDATPAMQAKPIEPDPVPEPKPKRAADDLTQVAGIGPALQRRLRNFGFRTIAELADADPNVLNEIQGAKGRGSVWVAEARKLVDG